MLTDRPMLSADRPSKKRKEPPPPGPTTPEEADGRRKKARTTFTGRQIFELERQFEIKKYLSSTERSDMAKLLSVTETQVGVPRAVVQSLRERLPLTVSRATSAMT